MDQNQLRKAMAALNLTQPVMAALLNVTPRAVSLWLNGDRSVPGTVDAYLNLFSRLSAADQTNEIKRVTKDTRPMQEGMYLLHFRGPNGEGDGTITLEAGRVYGFDVGGGLYDGTYILNPLNNMVSIDLEVRMPPNAFSVLGPSQPFSWTLTVKAEFDRDRDAPITAHTNIGPVEAQIRFMRSLPIAA